MPLDDVLPSSEPPSDAPPRRAVPPAGNSLKPSRHIPPEPGTQRPATTGRTGMLEARGPNNPSPEELATRVVEPLINDGPVMGGPIDAVPPAVLNLVAQLATAIDALDAISRAAALHYISKEVAKRIAG